MRKHMLTHTGERAFKCQHCDKSFTSSNNLKIHMVTHTREKTFTCHVCGKSFTRSDNMRKHVLTHTEGSPWAKCQRCDKSLRNMWDLERHTCMLTHTGERAFKCEVCRKSFALVRHIKSHMVTHTREKAFTC